MIWKVQIYHQHTVDNTMGHIPKGIYLTNFVHGESEIYYLVKALMENL